MILRLLFTLLLWLAGAAPVLAAVQVLGVRMEPASDTARVVLDLSGPAVHKRFALDDPARIVVDIPNAQFNARRVQLPPGSGPVASLRLGRQPNRTVRLVVELARKVEAQSFSLAPQDGQGHRLVLDVGGAPVPQPAAAAVPKPVVAAHAPGRSLRDLVIAIDAGHGGKDPGAIGRAGTQEKDVTLAMARELVRVINAEPGMRAVLTRTGDYFVALRERGRVARRHQADMFLSIHADAVANRHVSGSSVYVLSLRGASSEAARWLAEKENAADLVGGVSLDDKDQVLASVLLDLSQTASITASLDAAGRVLQELDRVGSLKRSQVQQAGFVVLKAPDIPSMLIETAFISNPDEEKRLRSPEHQARLARAIHAGVRNYFYANPPPGTRVAMLAAQASGRAMSHVVAPGETLAEVAGRYQVSEESLRRANRLAGDVLTAGVVLAVPLASR
jgi:N-acetylmuramoyl-L-alanine amidase